MRYAHTPVPFPPLPDLYVLAADTRRFRPNFVPTRSLRHGRRGKYVYFDASRTASLFEVDRNGRFSDVRRTRSLRGGGDALEGRGRRTLRFCFTFWASTIFVIGRRAVSATYSRRIINTSRNILLLFIIVLVLSLDFNAVRARFEYCDVTVCNVCKSKSQDVYGG